MSPHETALLEHARLTFKAKEVVMSAALTLVEAKQESVFSPEQRKLILQTCCGGASESDAKVLVSIAEARGLNPLTQECYFVQRGGKWSVQASIDSFRQKAEESGDYAGQDEPEFEYEADGSIKLARVKVYRRSVPGRPFAVGVARWSEYAQPNSPMWKKMAHTMLSKCSEGLALRKAFPSALAKVYTREEMMQADEGPSFAKALPRATQDAPIEAQVVTEKPDMNPRVLELAEMMAECVEPTELEEMANELRGIQKDKSANGKVIANAVAIYKAKLTEFSK